MTPVIIGKTNAAVMPEFAPALEFAFVLQMLVLGPFLIFTAGAHNRLKISLGMLCLIFGLLIGANLIRGLLTSVPIDLLTLLVETLLGPATFIILLQMRSDPVPIGWKDGIHGVVPLAIYGAWLVGALSSPDLPLLALHIVYAALCSVMLWNHQAYVTGRSFHIAVSILALFAVFILAKALIVLTITDGGDYRASFGYQTLLVMLLLASTSLLFLCLGAPAILDAPRAFRLYAGDAASASEQSLIIERLNKALSAREQLADPDLNLDRLADLVKAPKRHVSQAINTVHRMSVSAFLNERRISAAMGSLSNPDNTQSITDIMLDVGFSSKSTFNREFRKQAGMTPTQYRQQKADTQSQR